MPADIDPLRVAGGLYVGGLLALGPLGDLKTHLLAFFSVLKPFIWIAETRASVCCNAVLSVSQALGRHEFCTCIFCGYPQN